MPHFPFYLLTCVLPNMQMVLGRPPQIKYLDIAFITVLNIFNLLHILLLSSQIKVGPFMYKMKHLTSATPGIFTWS